MGEPTKTSAAPLSPDPEKIKAIAAATTIDREILETDLYSLRMLRLGITRHFQPYYWYLPPKWRVALRLLNGRRMMPSFLSLGAARSGTTLLADYIMQHPCVVLPLAKEFGVGSYASLRQLYAQFPSRRKEQEVKEKYGMAVTGYCAPAAPNLIFPHLINGLSESLDLRFVLILRNPVDRTFAHYRWERLVSRRSDDDPLLRGIPSFHELMKIEIEAARSFATSGSTFLSGALTGGFIQNSIYLPFLKEMLKFWARSRILVLNADDFFAHPPLVAKQVYDFLGLPAYEPVELSVRNAGRPGRMEPETRQMLVDFFAPLNRQLYDFLGEDFGWS